MAQKRKMEVTVVDEIDKDLFTIFQNAANQISQLYTEASSQQKRAFDAGKNHSLVKLCEWLDVKQQEGKMVTAADVHTYLQDELNSCAESSGLQEHRRSKSEQSTAYGKRQSEMVSSSSASTAQCHDNFQDMEMEITPEDTAH